MQRISAIFLLPFGKVLVGFRFLTSVCEIRRLSRTQNLRRALKNSGPVLSRLWSKVHEILGRLSGPLVLSNALVRLSYVVFRSEDIRH